jgi:hypothetical protein
MLTVQWLQDAIKAKGSITENGIHWTHANAERAVEAWYDAVTAERRSRPSIVASPRARALLQCKGSPRRHVCPELGERVDVDGPPSSP